MLTTKQLFVSWLTVAGMIFVLLLSRHTRNGHRVRLPVWKALLLSLFWPALAVAFAIDGLATLVLGPLD